MESNTLQDTEEKNRKKPRKLPAGLGKWFKKHKKLCIFAVVVLVLLIVLGRGRGNGTIGTTEEAQLRDIYTYRSFSGNVSAVSERPVVSKASAQVTELLAEEGDEVKEGDVLAILDSSAVEDSIALKESSLDATETSYAYNIRDAKRSYEDYKYTVDNDLNSSLYAAQQSVDNARSARNAARDDYNGAKAAIENGTYEATAEAYQAKTAAQSSYDKAVNDYNSAVAAYNTAKTSYEAAKSAYDAAKSAYDMAKAAQDQGTAADPTALQTAEQKLQEAETAQSSAQQAMNDRETAQNEAQNARNAAQNALNTANSAFESAKSSVLSAKQSAIDSAQSTLDDAKKNYEIVEVQVNQQLENYESALEKTKATATTETSRLELEQLKDSLNDYTITAPCDGTVTASSLTEGGMVSAGTTAFTITGLDTMEVAINVDEYSILNTTVGSAVTIYVDSIDRSYDGTLTYVADVAQLNNGVSYFEAKVSFQADEYVKSGMSVEVRLTSADEKNVLAVPADAVNYYEDNTPYVLIKNEKGEQQERAVEIGVSDGSWTQITAGLEEGDTVYVSSTGSEFESMMSTRRDMINNMED